VAAFEDLQRLGLVVGRVTAVGDHPGARAPSYLVTVELGPAGTREATVPKAGYDEADLVGRQVVCVPGEDELLLLAAHSHAGGLVLLRPDRDVEDGTPVA
jgi:tRNA-binding protein